MKLTIKRDSWLRGEGSENSKLLRAEDGKMCCLGFLARQLGYSDAQIMNEETPAEVVQSCNINHWPIDMIKQVPGDIELIDPYSMHQSITRDLMEINDEPVDPLMTEETREKDLTQLFSTIGIEVEFVD